MHDGGPARSREMRFLGVLEAFHFCQLDGLTPTHAAVRDGWDYIEGRRTLEELVEDVVRRHAQSPEGQDD